MLTLNLIDHCKPYPAAPTPFAIKLNSTDTVGMLREEIAKRLNYGADWFAFHLSPKDEPTHVEAFSTMTDVKLFFSSFFGEK